MPNCDVPTPGSRSSTVTLLKLIMSGAGYGFGLGIDTPEAAACEFACHAGVWAQMIQISHGSTRSCR
jgi:hypothetical protein